MQAQGSLGPEGSGSVGSWAAVYPAPASYDANGNLTTQIDARGQVTLYSYDALGRLTNVGIPVLQSVSAGTPTSIAQSINGLRTQIDTRRTQNGLSGYGWLSPTPAGLTTNAHISAGTYTELRSALDGAYTVGGNLLPDFTLGAPVGTPVARPVRIADLIDLDLWAYGSYPGSMTPLVSYGYDSGTNGKGRRTTMTDTVGTTSYVYNQRGQPTTETRVQGGTTYQTQMTYDDAGHVLDITYPDSAGEVVQTAYSDRGLPLIVGTVASPTVTPFISAAGYDGMGRQTTITFDDSSQSIYTYYDPTTTLINFAVPAKSVYRAYATNGVRNIRCIDPGVTHATDYCYTNSLTAELFTYDAQNRLTSMGNTNSGSTVTDPDTYAYDTGGLGEIVTKTEGAVAVTLAYANSQPVHAPSSVTVNGIATSYSYDAVGNLTSRGTTTYTYDFQNHLTKVNQNGSITTFGYDGDGKLVRRVDPNGTTTDYVGEIYEKSTTSGGSSTETKRYYLGSRLIATRVGGTLSYLYDDPVHSTAASSNGSKAEYTPYGLTRTSTGSLPTDRQFQGQQNQSTIGLYHMGARWYDPQIGLWTQPDTIVPNPIDPLAFNRYRFVGNNPLTYADPSGHAMCAVCESGGGGSSISNPVTPGILLGLLIALGVAQAPQAPIAQSSSGNSSASQAAVSASSAYTEATTPGGVDPEETPSAYPPEYQKLLDDSNSSDPKRALGAQRVLRVARSVGMDKIKAYGDPLKLEGQRLTDADILVNGDRPTIIEVGGLAKGTNLGKWGAQLAKLVRYAEKYGMDVRFYYDSNTPQEAIDLALKWLGSDNVLPIPP